jgi:hypothetical protein
MLESLDSHTTAILETGRPSPSLGCARSRTVSPTSMLDTAGVMAI